MNIARYRAKLPGLLPAGEGAWRSQPGRPGETEPATRGCKFTRGYKKKASGTSSSPEASIKNGSYLLSHCD
ncbi:hypothetical protein, partial [Phocaeicola dorei]|uniref:hypothetical protein n=1 Tax=Phocaeicola dorei TaxID=357276 RepID=UPI001E4E7FB6